MHLLMVRAHRVGRSVAASVRDGRISLGRGARADGAAAGVVSRVANVLMRVSPGATDVDVATTANEVAVVSQRKGAEKNENGPCATCTAMKSSAGVEITEASARTRMAKDFISILKRRARMITSFIE